MYLAELEREVAAIPTPVGDLNWIDTLSENNLRDAAAHRLHIRSDIINNREQCKIESSVSSRLSLLGSRVVHT